MSNSLWPHGLQHARLSCPSPSPRVYSNSWPLSWWCHATISSSVFTLSCCLWPKYWSFSFSISPSNEYSGLISFRFDWFELLAVQETLKSLLQHHSLKASILWCSAFFMVQLSHPYLTTEKAIDLTIQTFVSKVMSLLFDMLSMFDSGRGWLWISTVTSYRNITFPIWPLNSTSQKKRMLLLIKM